MKKLVSIVLISVGSMKLNAQLITPKASPLAKMEQKVGLTDIKIEYSRPSKNGRTIFGDVVPYNEIWRTGANENTKITTTDPLIFGTDTLKPGTYALFVKPTEKQWEIYFYTEITNWGVPSTWSESKISIKQIKAVTTLQETIETFTISMDDLENETATLNFAWDKVKVSVPFQLLTHQKVLSNIQKVMNGPSASDYYAAGNYYFTSKVDLKKALEWVSKALELQPDTYYMMRTKAMIQKELGDIKGAVETAKKTIVLAEKAGNKQSVTMLTNYIKEWETKK